MAYFCAAINAANSGAQWPIITPPFTSIPTCIVPNKVQGNIELQEVKDGSQAILDEFFAAINEDRQPECSAEDNLQSLVMVFGVIQSAKAKREVKLSELQTAFDFVVSGASEVACARFTVGMSLAIDKFLVERFRSRPSGYNTLQGSKEEELAHGALKQPEVPKYWKLAEHFIARIRSGEL